MQQLMAKQRAKVKALDDASDVGINARALTVVAAVTNSAKLKQDSGAKGNAPIAVASKTASRLASKVAPNSTTCIITGPTASGSSTVGRANPSVQLVQLAGGNATQMRQASLPNGGQGSNGTNPTSLIFNLSQFHNGNGIIILNSAAGTTQAGTVTCTSEPMGAPVTLLYSRPNTSTNGTNVTTAVPNTLQIKPIAMQTNTSETTVHVKTELSDSHFADMSAEPAYGAFSSGQTVTAMDVANGNFTIESPPSAVKPELNDSQAALGCLDNEASSQRSSFASSPSKHSDELDEQDMILGLSPPFDQTDVPRTQLLAAALGQGKVGVDNLPQDNINQTFARCMADQTQQAYATYPSQHQQNLSRSNQMSGHQVAQSLSFSDMDPVDMNPMDFIDNDIPTPDEDLFNLDAFEMLTEFSNLDDLNFASSPFKNQNPKASNGSSGTHQNSAVRSPECLATSSAEVEFRDSSAQISDYSPEWSYPEGGMKVLVAGPWQSSSSLQYTILFDGVTVPTSLVQHGVLRCFSPAHEPGFVTLQVAAQGCIVSNSVIFEYREHPATPSTGSEDYFAVDGKRLARCFVSGLHH